MICSEVLGAQRRIPCGYQAWAVSPFGTLGILALPCSDITSILIVSRYYDTILFDIYASLSLQKYKRISDRTASASLGNILGFLLRLTIVSNGLHKKEKKIYFQQKKVRGDCVTSFAFEIAFWNTTTSFCTVLFLAAFHY